MKLSFNDHALKHLASSQIPDREGRLLYKKDSKSKYKERWFRLFGNLLFYYKTNEFGVSVSSEPVGVLVLVDHESAYEEQSFDGLFVFSITFGSSNEDGSKSKHFFSGSSRDNCMAWVDAITGINYDGLKTRLAILRKRIELVTGSDPVQVSFEKTKQKASLPSSSKSTSHSMFYAPSVVVTPVTRSSEIAIAQSAAKNQNTNSSLAENKILSAGNGNLHTVQSMPILKMPPGSGMKKSRDQWETFN